MSQSLKLVSVQYKCDPLPSVSRLSPLTLRLLRRRLGPDLEFYSFVRQRLSRQLQHLATTAANTEALL